MNPTMIIEQQLIGKDEDELLDLFVKVAEELASMRPDQPKFHVTEASLETIKRMLPHARTRTVSRYHSVAR